MAKDASANFVWDGFRRFRGRLLNTAVSAANRLRVVINLRGSLRTHLFVFAAALVLPLFLLLGLALSSIVSLEMTKTRERLLYSAEAIARDIDREIFGYLTVLKTLSTTRTLELGEFKEFHARAKASLADRGARVLLLDTQLQQLLNTHVPYGTPLPKTADEETAQAVIATRQPHISNVFTGQVSGQRVINIEMPVIHDGTLRYVLVIALEARHFAGILSEAAVAERHIVTLSDRSGSVIASAPQGNPVVAAPPSIRTETGKHPSLLEFPDASGEKWLEASVRSDLTGWRTSVIAPSAYVTEVLWMSIRWFCYAVIAAAVLTVLLGTMLGRRMAEAIKELRQATRELAEGRPIQPRDPALKEARAVLRSLDRAAEFIASRSATLKLNEERSREDTRQINTLMNELAHRNKNQLSVILAMARQLANTSESLPQFMEKFVQRIMAKAAAQDLVSRGISSGVPLRMLLDNQMTPFAGESSPQIEVSGPEALLTAEAARTIGMAFHELATNATKYGALRSPEGRIHVSWSVRQPDRKLMIEWRESGGPAVATPQRQGFGHNIVDRYVSRTLQAEVSYSFPQEGIVWRMEADNLLI